MELPRDSGTRLLSGKEVVQGAYRRGCLDRKRLVVDTSHDGGSSILTQLAQ
jgi:hypothetical protein